MLQADDSRNPAPVSPNRHAGANFP